MRVLDLVDEEDVELLVRLELWEEVLEKLLEVLELLDLVMLLVSVSKLVSLVKDTLSEESVDSRVVFSATVVSPLTITFVVPSITVVEPDMENLGSTTVVVGPSITNLVEPSITVILPGKGVIVAPGFATVVGPGITINGVPSIVVVIPP